MSTARASDSQGPVSEFFGQAWRAFERARLASAVNPLDQLIEVGGNRVRLTFAGGAMLANIMPALAHLTTTAPVAAHLHVAVWDSASTATPLPPTPWSGDALVARGEIKGIEHEPGMQIACQPGSGILSMLDRRTGRGMLWLPDATQCPYWEKAAPMRSLFHWSLLATHQQLVHGAAVGDGEAALLLTGKGGSGKSSTALAALVSGMSFLGDDYVLCNTQGDRPRVSSLYNSAKVDDGALQRLPQLAGKLHREDANQEKAVILTHQHFPQRLATSLELRAIVVPRVTGMARHAISPIKASAAFLALAPTTVFQLPGAGNASTGILRDLVSSLPCYRLDLGTDAGQIPTILRQLLAQT